MTPRTSGASVHENRTFILTWDWSLRKSHLRTQSRNQSLRLELKSVMRKKLWQKITEKRENERPEKEIKKKTKWTRGKRHIKPCVCRHSPTIFNMKRKLKGSSFIKRTQKGRSIVFRRCCALLWWFRFGALVLNLRGSVYIWACGPVWTDKMLSQSGEGKKRSDETSKKDVIRRREKKHTND